MKFTLNWLREHLEGDYSLTHVVGALNTLGLEVEEVKDPSSSLNGFIVAHILEAEKHPDADRLKVCKVAYMDGKPPLQIVCGAPNARAGIKVVLALPGVVIPSIGKELKPGVIRGIESQGMLCSASELCLSNESEGILELPENAAIGSSVVDALGLADPMIDIAITPNRGDCLGVRGIARDLASKSVGALKALKIPEIKGAFNVETSVRFDFENKEDCPVFMARVIRGVKNGESPTWLKRRLEAVGQNSISLLVDLSNYFMIEFNRPSHFFDLKDIKGEIVLRSAKENELFVALKGVEHHLPKGAIVLEDNDGILSLGGIKGGERGGVSDSTTDILIEMAHFHADRISETGRALGLLSDARYRFERFVDLHQLNEMMDLMADFVIQNAGGVASNLQVTGKIEDHRKAIAFDPQLIKILSNVDVSDKEAFEILARLGCVINGQNITPPTWRPDITLPEDLVEEVLRIKGYDHIEAISMPRATQKIKNFESMKFDHLQYIRKGLTSKGYLEAVTFSFMHSAKAEMFGVDLKTVTTLVKNPISSELDIMRPSILPNLLQAVSHNQARSVMSGGLFEIGPQYQNSDPQGQSLMISGLKYGLTQEKEWHSPQKMVDVYDIRGAVDFITNNGDYTISQEGPSWYHPGRVATLKVKDKIVGYFGEIHPKILKAFDVKGPAAAFEIFHGNLKISSAKSEFQKSIYQPVERDFAFVLSKTVPAQSLLKAIESLKIKEISSLKLFDVYEGTGLKEDQKSIALRAVFESFDHTFQEDEIETFAKAIITAVEQSTGGTLRQ